MLNIALSFNTEGIYCDVTICTRVCVCTLAPLCVCVMCECECRSLFSESEYLQAWL